MGVNKVVINTANGEQVLVDLTGDSVVSDSLVVGHTAHGADGELVNGANPYELQETNTEVQTQTDLISQIQTALIGKASGGTGKPEQEKTVDITENGTVEVIPDDGYVLSKVTAVVNVEVGGNDEDIAAAIVDRTVTEFINDKATGIGEYVFRSCTKLTTVDAPNAKSIGQYAFTSCSDLSSVKLLSVENVGQYAFNQCNKIRSITLPSLTSVSTNAFRDMQYCETIDLPKLTGIPANAFYGCRGLKALILRAEQMVTLANSNAFTTCYRLLGTKNSGFNPNGERLGWIYVHAAYLEQYAADTVWSGTDVEFRAIEDYPEICGVSE